MQASQRANWLSSKKHKELSRSCFSYPSLCVGFHTNSAPEMQGPVASMCHPARAGGEHRYSKLYHLAITALLPSFCPSQNPFLSQVTPAATSSMFAEGISRKLFLGKCNPAPHTGFTELKHCIWGVEMAC